MGLYKTMFLPFVSIFILIFQPYVAGVPTPSSGMVLRIRLADGSMEKVMVPPGAEEKLTLDEVLKPFNIDKEKSSIQVGQASSSTSTTDTEKKKISELGVKHGTLITIQSTSTKASKEPSRFAQLKVDKSKMVWNPFPDLAKDYEHALLKTKTRRSSTKGMSYGDIARLQSSLHIVEPQQKGPLLRVYMCRNAAERFHANGITKSSKKGSPPAISCRVGLLLGTIQKERVDLKPRRARTSLSSQTSDSEFCTVTKVQAIWEPTNDMQVPKNTNANVVYNKSTAQNLLSDNPRILQLADALGLVPVGWIFSHTDNRHGGGSNSDGGNDDNGDTLPVFGLDVQTGAMLQISNMKSRGEVDGVKFVTLAMDATTGATEAFQLSDVCVQMVYEDLLVTEEDKSTNNKITKKKPPTRHVPTKHAILVDGKETNELDSVLCLVNTAMLSHVGSFSGKTAASSVKKSSGGLTIKAKKALLAAMASSSSTSGDGKLLEELCDFNALVALDQALSTTKKSSSSTATLSDDMKTLCEAVRKWARGQKQGTTVPSKLKMRLKGVLET